MMKVSIIAATISGNKGAESMFQSAIQTIPRMYPEVQFNLYTYYPEEDSRRNQNQNVRICSGTPLELAFVLTPISFLYRILNLIHVPTSFLKNIPNFAYLAESDVVIDMAGISFVDGREKYLPFNIACILPPILLNKKIIKYSQALGPFNNPVNNFLAKKFLPQVDCIVARGEITNNYLESLELNNIGFGADGAFLMEIDNNACNVISDYLDEGLIDKKIVGVSPSSVIEKYCIQNGINYHKIMAEFINNLIEYKDYNVIIVPHSVRKYSLNSKNNDLPVSRLIHENVNDKNRCILIADELNAMELRAIISKCDFFIASRFHAMISSLAMKVPTLVCGWSHKYLEVLQMFELQDYAFDYKGLNFDTLWSKFLDMENNEKEIRKRLDTHLPEVVKSAYNNINYIKNLLEA